MFISCIVFNFLIKHYYPSCLPFKERLDNSRSGGANRISLSLKTISAGTKVSIKNHLCPERPPALGF